MFALFAPVIREAVAAGGSRSVREAQVLGSESDSDESGPVYGGRSDDEGLLLLLYN